MRPFKPLHQYVPLVCGESGRVLGGARCPDGFANGRSSCLARFVPVLRQDQRAASVMNSYSVVGKNGAMRIGQVALQVPQESDAHWPLSCCVDAYEGPSEWPYQSRQTDTGARIHRAIIFGSILHIDWSIRGLSLSLQTRCALRAGLSFL